MTDTLAWDTYSQKKPARRETNAAGETTWFNWTQYPDHGPGAEVIGAGPGASVLELGCGKGGNLAHVAALGARAVGVDLSAAQLDAARERWDGLELHQRDAVDHLAGCGERFDAVYSVFGAVWFTNPDTLLPAVRDRLSPGGILAFSQRPAIEGCYGCQASYVNRHDDPEPLVVRRWDYTPEAWVERLRANGFTDVTAEVIPAPEGNRRTGTLLVRAARRSGNQG
ncbi:class I SAM-dependent methyltransferase [Streptomyces sp. SID12488]|uniref:class I SAM-dependent DNA methyltransferase n=1 Tax=Streptomyces sp. SID12488 TaxID=2706040 RepID=UPI0013DAAB83|nr:class I SAM-dependent methyltransferase [Streptomyces sp. SID12488]NEA64427.1 methyltransferase domain-containing protein [Streptomyces sp. SID12488]